MSNRVSKGRYQDRLADLWPVHYRPGMWGWVLHRVTGVALALYLFLHLTVVSSAVWNKGGSGFDRVLKTFHTPWGIALDLLLIAAVIFHAVNGLRLLLFDLGIGVRRQKELLAGAVVLGAAAWGAALWFLLPFVFGRGLPEG